VTVTDRKLTHHTGVVRLEEKVPTHYEGRKGLEDLGGRPPPCPRNERTSSWSYRKTIDNGRSRNKKPDLTPRRRKSRTGPCGGVDRLQNEKEKTARRGGAGNVEAPAPTTTKII
jgi:hypothetical protein